MSQGLALGIECLKVKKQTQSSWQSTTVHSVYRVQIDSLQQRKTMLVWPRHCANFIYKFDKLWSNLALYFIFCFIFVLKGCVKSSICNKCSNWLFSQLFANQFFFTMVRVYIIMSSKWFLDVLRHGHAKFKI